MLSLPATTGDRPVEPESFFGARLAGASFTRASSLIYRLEIAFGVLFTFATVYLHVMQSRVAGGLWRDEAVSAQVANLPSFGLIWRYLEFDSYPPLFHLLLRAWSKLFSSDDVSLRTLGLMIGLSVIAALWMGARVLGARVPLFALVLLGLNPMVIRYGDSIRAYGLGCTLAVLTLVSVWRVAADERIDWRRGGVAMLTAILSVQCLYHNAALLLACCLGGSFVALWQRRPKLAVVIVGVGAAAAVSLLPYLPIIARTRRWSVLLKFPVTFSWLWEKLSEVTGAPDPLGIWLWSSLAMVGLGLAGWRIRSAWVVQGAIPADTRRQVFAAISLAAGSLTYAGFLVAVGYVTQPWYYLAFLAVAALCLDTIFGQAARDPGWRLFRLVVAIAFASTTFGQTGERLQVRSTNIDLVAARLNASVASGDLVLVNRWECAISLNRYYRGPARLMTVPPIDDHLVHRYDLFMQCMETADPLRPVFDAIGATLRGGGRVWFVGYLGLLAPGVAFQPLPPVSVKVGEAWPFSVYWEGWEVQADEFLHDHAQQMTAVKIPVDRPVSGFENQPLRFFNGWKESPSTNGDQTP